MAAGSTYTPLATNTLGSSATSITFSSISTSYTDLVAVFSGSITTATRVGLNIQVGNGTVDTGSNYSITWLSGNGTTAYSGKDTSSGAILSGGIISNTISFSTVNFLNYSNTLTYKTTLVKSGNLGSTAQQDVATWVGQWRSTSAINTIKFYPDAGASFSAGTMITLYGIAAA